MSFGVGTYCHQRPSRNALRDALPGYKIKKARWNITILLQGRVDWIRTSDPLHPIQVRYRAAPPPESLGLQM